MLRQTQVPVLDGSQCRASGAVQRLAAVLPGLDQSTFLCAGGQRSVDACHVSVGRRYSANQGIQVLYGTDCNAVSAKMAT